MWFHVLSLFAAHVVPYWTCVWLYDTFSTHYETARNASIRNQLFVTLPCMLLIVNIYPISYENFMHSMAFVPYLAIAADFYFYVVHRPLHTKWLWRFHRAHHAGDISVVRSLDADMLEHLVANIGMVLVGISSLWWCDIVLNFGVLVFWTAFATINTCISHSHGKMPFDNGIHYVHHCTLTANYGFGICFPDRVLGTFKNNMALNR